MRKAYEARRRQIEFKAHERMRDDTIALDDVASPGSFSGFGDKIWQQKRYVSPPRVLNSVETGRRPDPALTHACLTHVCTPLTHSHHRGHALSQEKSNML